MTIESYKGIEFVRISALSIDEQALIRRTFDHDKVINILRDKELLKDCIQVNDYQQWKKKESVQAIEASPAAHAAIQELKLAFK